MFTSLLSLQATRQRYPTPALNQAQDSTYKSTTALSQPIQSDRAQQNSQLTGAHIYPHCPRHIRCHRQQPKSQRSRCHHTLINTTSDTYHKDQRAVACSSNYTCQRNYYTTRQIRRPTDTVTSDHQNNTQRSSLQDRRHTPFT